MPDNLSSEFIAAAQEALSDIARVTLLMGDLRQALLEDGSPATPKEIKTRFENYVATLSKGKDTSKIRIVVE